MRMYGGCPQGTNGVHDRACGVGVAFVAWRSRAQICPLGILAAATTRATKCTTKWAVAKFKADHVCIRRMESVHVSDEEAPYSRFRLYPFQ